MAFANPRTHCIAVGYDGSQAARGALAFAGSRRATRSWSSYPFTDGPSVAIRDGHGPVFGEQGIYRQALLAELEDGNGTDLKGLDYEIEVVRGSPAAALADVARSCGADEIVIGSRGPKSASAVGSISYELLQIADRPVVVVPSNQRETQTESKPVQFEQAVHAHRRSMRHGSPS